MQQVLSSEKFRSELTSLKLQVSSRRPFEQPTMQPSGYGGGKWCECCLLFGSSDYHGYQAVLHSSSCHRRISSIWFMICAAASFKDFCSLDMHCCSDFLRKFWFMSNISHQHLPSCTSFVHFCCMFFNTILKKTRDSVGHQCVLHVWTCCVQVPRLHSILSNWIQRDGPLGT